jgi:hypothetical protein
MVLDKDMIQKEVDKSLLDGKYTEGVGRIMLLLADISAQKRGLIYRYSEFEVDFIIKPRIVDMLLLKLFKYKKESASAYTFMSLITSTAILDAIRDLRRVDKGDNSNIFYIEDIGREMSNLEYNSDLHDCLNDVYMDGGLIKLK